MSVHERIAATLYEWERYPAEPTWDELVKWRDLPLNQGRPPRQCWGPAHVSEHIGAVDEMRDRAKILLAMCSPIGQP